MLAAAIQRVNSMWFAVIVALAVAVAAVLLVAYLAAPRPAHPRGMYFPAPERSLAGLFYQHLRLYLPDNGDAYNYLLAEVNHARHCRHDAVVIALTCFAPRIVLLHASDGQHCLVGNASNYVKGADPYEKIEFILGKTGLVVLRDEAQHTAMRKLVAPAFNPRLLAILADTVASKHVAEMCRAIDREYGTELALKCGSAELDQIFSEVALNIIAESAFRRVDVSGTNVAAEFAKLQDLSLRNFKYVFLPLWARRIAITVVPFARSLFTQVAGSIAKIRHAAVLMVTDARSRPADEDNQRSLVDVLAHESAMTDDMVGDAALTFMLAGHETTAKALAWTAYLLAYHPRAQEALFDELVDAVPRAAVPNLDDVKNLQMLNNVIKESMRVRPPVPSVMRCAVRADTLPSGLRIAAGEKVLIAPIVFHHDPAIWGHDAEEFRPERWEAPELAAKLGLCGYMPFLIGKRNCIGKDFAMNELLLTIATLCRRYVIECVEDEPFPLRRVAITLRPHPPSKLRLIKRAQ